MRDREAWMIAVTLLAAAGIASGAPTPGRLCESRAAAALWQCTSTVAKQQYACVKRTGAACAADDAKLLRAFATLERKTLEACPDGATLADAGYGAVLTPAGLVARLHEASAGSAASLLARSYGGPQVAVRAAGTPDGVKCLDYAYTQGRKLIDYAAKQQSACIVKTRAGGVCDPAQVEAKIATRQAKTVTAIGARCPDLRSLVAIDPAAFASRDVDQAQCLVASVHPQPAPLDLPCGPRAEVPVPPPATPTQVVLPASTGALCGDGSPYAFWIRLAPAGQPVNRVLVYLLGGGSCADGPECAATDPDLFESLGDGMVQGGIMSSTASTNPFRDWTKVYLPYCTQDLHTGGGVTTAFPEITVHRNGALNVRAAMRRVRDVLWTTMNASDPDGFRPDRLVVLFSGSSAGGFGAMFNYHYLLDDLRWTHASVLPDAALSMDNGQPIGVISRAAFALQPDPPGWNAEPYAAPYCHDAACGVLLNTLEFAHAARPLKVVPEQQILNLSNQVDGVQRKTQFFATNGDFVNSMRARYCEQKGTTGLHSFLSALLPAVHGQILDNQNYNNVSIGGTIMRDWLGGAMTAPDAVVDEIAEGTIVPDVNGALPFPCTVGSPSGAFLDDVAG